jgi:hypothetical protein
MAINFPCPRCGSFHAVQQCSPEAALAYLSGMLTLPGFTTKASAIEDEQIRRYLGHREQQRP